MSMNFAGYIFDAENEMWNLVGEDIYLNMSNANTYFVWNALGLDLEDTIAIDDFLREAEIFTNADLSGYNMQERYYLTQRVADMIEIAKQVRELGATHVGAV